MLPAKYGSLLAKIGSSDAVVSHPQLKCPAPMTNPVGYPYPLPVCCRSRSRSPSSPPRPPPPPPSSSSPLRSLDEIPRLELDAHTASRSSNLLHMSIRLRVSHRLLFYNNRVRVPP